jgi:signal transduction histidine kinase
VDDARRTLPPGQAVRRGQWLNVVAVATWLVCGLAPMRNVANPDVPAWASATFVSAFLLFGAALLLLLYLPQRGPHGRSLPIVLLAVESVSAMIVVYVSGHHLGGTSATTALVVVVAAQLPYVVSATWAWACIGVQTALLSLLFLGEDPLDDLISGALAIGGFQAFATASSLLALKEAAARAQLAQVNADLQAAHERLAESSRTEERLRISRDLHDSLGHHLAALSLQLDVASRVSEGKAADHLRQAHAITRLLLSDVRDVVGTLRDARPIDLAGEIRSLADAPATIAIHLEMPESLEVPDRERAQALLRCVQEIITNAARHAHARNLWIRIAARSDGVTLHARDDGRGAPQLSLGHGLTGMRERFAALAGSVEFESGPETGFEVRGFMPTPHPAA